MTITAAVNRTKMITIVFPWAICRSLIAGIITVLAWVKRIGMIIAFPLACLFIVAFVGWIIFSDTSAPNFYPGAGNAIAATAASASGQDDGGFWGIFQAIGELDQLWAKANQMERAYAETGFNFNPPFMGWLNRDRENFRQEGNAVIYDDGQNKAIIFLSQ